MALPIRGLPENSKVVVNLITNRFEIVDNARDVVMRAAEAIANNFNRLQASAEADS